MLLGLGHLKDLNFTNDILLPILFILINLFKKVFFSIVKLKIKLNLSHCSML